MAFTELCYERPEDLGFGRAVNPAAIPGGPRIGAGRVIPEINFTLPPMEITEQTFPRVLQEYRAMVEGVCARSVELDSKELVIELELLPPMTYRPEWGVAVTRQSRDIVEEYRARDGLAAAIRVTPVDIREDKASPHMWRGAMWERLMETFHGCAEAGASLLSIESIGGKDVHDKGLMYCDLRRCLFGLGVLGIRDMARLWTAITAIARETDTISAGDTACGFANTAMVLADKRYIPAVFSAVIRVLSAVRSLEAFEQGATGPDKDCGYEGIYIKAVTGRPVSMEGKSSACAHLSHVGNIAAATADLWSNESVQNVKLLGGMAPTICLEQLVYDCRLMNGALERGPDAASLLRDLMIDSDASRNPQALVLAPDVVVRIARRFLRESSPFTRAVGAARAALDELEGAAAEGRLAVSERDLPWLAQMREQLDTVEDEESFVREMADECRGEGLRPEIYDLA